MDSPLLAVVFTLLCCASVNAVSVNTSVGEIIGFQYSYKNAAVNKFFGIPYAEPPTGDLRFRPPVPKARFTTPFSATKFGAPCIQNPSGLAAFPHQNVSEDCLSLNVYVPTTGSLQANKAVMVWIYGGAFSTGASFLYDGTKMAANGDVIVVTLNYRVGIFGFFTTGDANASGNYGLLDQQLALKWVKKNIGAFGGDQNRVTIFGESAGAASVTWQMLAPSNQGLFHRVIAESGVASCPWSLPDPITTSEYTKRFANAVGCAREEPSEVVACLRKLPAMAIGQEKAISGWPHSDLNNPRTPAGPRVDGEFIPTSPNCREPGHRIEDQPVFRSVDFLLGSNRFEGSPFFELYNGGYYLATGTSLYNGVPESTFDHIAKSYGGLNNVDSIKHLRNKYTMGKNQLPDARELLEFIGDAMFYSSIMKFANSHANSSPRSTYFYSFLPKPSRSPLSGGVPIAPYVNGSIHGDEVGFLLANESIWTPGSGMYAPGEKELSDAMITYWTNFARSGNPNVPVVISYQWPEYRPEERKFMEFDIKNKQLDLRTNSFYRSQYLSYWDVVKPRLPSLCVMRPNAASSIRPFALFVMLLIAAILKLIMEV